MKPPYYFATAIIALCVSCNSADKQGQPESTSAKAIEASEQNFSGLLTRNSSEMYFMDCAEGKKYYFIKDETGEIDSFYESAQFQSYEGEAVYCELKGILQSANNQPNYHDGLLTVKSILKAQPKNFRNTCIPYEYWGVGTEPFWSLQISQGENLIDWKDGSKEITHRFKYAPPIINGNMITYNATENETGKVIQIQIEPRSCSDGMSEMQYEYEMSFTYDRENFSGCAIKWGNIPSAAN
jgi:uncharacterized membrane protein